MDVQGEMNTEFEVEKGIKKYEKKLTKKIEEATKRLDRAIEECSRTHETWALNELAEAATKLSKLHFKWRHHRDQVFFGGGMIEDG